MKVIQHVALSDGNVRKGELKTGRDEERMNE